MTLPIALQPYPFPVATLPPKIRAAVEEVIAITKAPPALVASSALAAVSLAVQGKYDVQRLPGLVSPSSLYFITFGESGERKTTVDRLLFSTFSKFEDEMNYERGESKSDNEGVPS